MTCRDVEDVLLFVSGAAIPPDLAAHIAGCEPCQRLVHAMADAGLGAAPTSGHLKQIEAAILVGLKPVRPLPHARWLSLMLLLGIVVVVGGGERVFGSLGWSALAWTQRLAMFTVLAAGVVLLAFSGGRQVVPGSRLLVPPALAPVGIPVVVAVLVTVLFPPHHQSAFVSQGLKCLAIGLVCSILAGVLLWLLLRRGAILHPMVTGPTAGVLAGLGGLTVLEIHCPNLDMDHILAWHVGALLVSALVGMAIGAVAERLAPGRRAL